MSAVRSWRARSQVKCAEAPRVSVALKLQIQYALLHHMNETSHRRFAVLSDTPCCVQQSVPWRCDGLANVDGAMSLSSFHTQKL